MNVLFLVFSTFLSVKEKSAGIYADLVREFIKNGHTVYRLFPTEEIENEASRIFQEPGQYVVKANVGKVRGNSNMIQKGLNTVLLEPRIKDAIKKNFADIRFDLVLYATPPVTFYSAVQYIKIRDKAHCYLMLKDIFPQGAIDLGLLSKRGIRGIAYALFRRKEKQLYRISDYIGCMSKANIEYLLTHNEDLDKRKIELLPNSIDPVGCEFSNEEKTATRDYYKIPTDKIVFIYGGNLGKPQGIPFLIELLKQVDSQRKSKEVLDKSYFIIVGDGSEYPQLEEYYKTNKPSNMLLLKRLEQEEYDRVVGCSDIGMIFLDYRFTIPNFPSRLMSYMQAKMPVICFTDPVTDIGDVVVDSGFGWKGESNDTNAAVGVIEEACRDFNSDKIEIMRENSWRCLVEKYSVSNAYETIVKHFKSK